MFSPLRFVAKACAIWLQLLFLIQTNQIFYAWAFEKVRFDFYNELATATSVAVFGAAGFCNRAFLRRPHQM